MTISIKNLTVVIVSFHSQEVIDDCIRSISSEIQIIVVENSGDKNTKSTLEDRYKNVKCILAPENLGMGAGNNFGITFVQTDFAFILNPDVILEKNTIEEIIIASKNLETFGLIAPISNNLNYPNYKIFKKNNFSINKNFPFRVESVDGYAMILNIKKLKQLDHFRNNNFFDENFFLYLENDDLCKRINDNNNKIFIVPTSRINHLGGKAVRNEYNEQIELSRNWHWMWSKFYFNKKHKGFMIAFLNNFPTFLSAVLKFFLYSILNHKKKYVYYHRASGFLNALLCKKSYHRPKINN
jgi:GT2 family glycosyltransferase|tara:strand:+ start:9 stop:899 length:891 start_codon:yes stop_codon:yes gene_type:complete